MALKYSIRTIAATPVRGILNDNRNLPVNTHATFVQNMKNIIVFLLAIFTGISHIAYSAEHGKPVKWVYIYENDTICQKLQITSFSERQIDFALKTINKARKLTSEAEGKAISRNQDPEIDEDEYGDAYPAIEYVFIKGHCSLSIRIDMDKKDKLQINESDCPNLRNQYCPLGSVGILSIQK